VSDEKRRDIRYPARIMAQVVRRGERVELLTNDVSYRGAFIRTDSPPALRQLVKVTFALPDGSNVSAHAMVVHVVEPNGHETVPGVGVQFWGPIGESKSWEQFIYDLKRREKAGMPAARATDKVRRASERFRLQLDVEIGGKRAVTRDVSETGMAIRTEMAIPEGTRLQANVHTSGGEAVSVEVIVKRRIVEQGFTGLGVEYVDTSADQKRALLDFIRANSRDEDAIFIDPDDPGLH
jgi:hypothetical protein